VLISFEDDVTVIILHIDRQNGNEHKISGQTFIYRHGLTIDSNYSTTQGVHAVRIYCANVGLNYWKNGIEMSAAWIQGLANLKYIGSSSVC
jgi:hypothetical protein